uniref:Putative receptor expression-enhancing protein 2 n=1 Tax=Ixodes ricinus TaxID=34613 RepID=V5IBT0_IXORI
MISGIISRLIVMVCGMLYPAYASYKVSQEQGRPGIYEIGLYCLLWVSFFRHSLPVSKPLQTSSSLGFRFTTRSRYSLSCGYCLQQQWARASFTDAFVHPQLMLREPEIDEMIARARDQGYTAVLQLGSRGLSYAANVVVQTAIKGAEVLPQAEPSHTLPEPAANESNDRRGTHHEHL